ncbi:MAG: cupin, partial [Bacteroidales bacterium]|nr:cupin [Bacteroidales bacterium]
MTVITPDRMLVEVETTGHAASGHTHWISEPGGLTQFGACVQVL